ncbi:MAG: type II secretion system F family protein [Anaerolineae bacterium]|nr:type II secretion system F family protein [Anaerolineae bacterium]
MLQFYLNYAFGGGLIIVGILLLIYSIIIIFLKDNISDRAKTYASSEEMHQQILNGIFEEEREGSLWKRTLGNWSRSISKVIGKFMPKQSLENLNRKISIAGHPYGLTGGQFMSIRLILVLIGLFLDVLIYLQPIAFNRKIMAIIALPLVLYLVTTVWLDSLVRRNKDIIRKDLPDTLDMLSVCATAGLGFDQSLQRVSHHWENLLGEELNRVISEMEVGVSRSDALRNLSTRLEISELSTFISVIIQSESLGISIAETLHIQAEQVRLQRRFSIQEQAQKLPAKMIFPLAFCILPALLAVILGPSVALFTTIF